MKFQSKKIKIAVIGEQDLKGSIFNNLSEQKSITSIVENALKSDISTTSKFTLVERREISNILKQNDLNKSTDTEEINNAAKKLGVEYILYALVDDASADAKGGMKVTISYTLTSLATSEIVLSYRSIEGERSETPQIALQTAITKSSKRFVAEHLVITFMDSASILAVDAKEGFLIDKGTSDGFTMALDFEIYEESAGAFGDLFKTKKVICLARAKQCESNKSLLITGEYKSDFRIRNEWKEKQELLKIINKGYKIRTIARRETTRII